MSTNRGGLNKLWHPHVLQLLKEIRWISGIGIGKEAKTLKQNKKIYNNMYLLLTKEVNLKGCTSDFGRRDFKKVLFIDI